MQQDFSEIVDRFIIDYCRVGNGLSIPDRMLFPAFRAFWRATAREAQHPALLGQFRVALAERGFKSNGPKRPRWYGLTLHRLTLLSEELVDTAKTESRRKAMKVIIVDGVAGGASCAARLHTRECSNFPFPFIHPSS